MEPLLHFGSGRGNAGGGTVADGAAGGCRTLFENGDARALSRLREIRAAKDAPYDRNEWQYHVLGRNLYQQGKIKAALDVASQYGEAFPQSSRALDDLADVYKAMGDKKKAIMLFEKSAKLDPFDANAVENLRWVGQ